MTLWTAGGIASVCGVQTVSDQSFTDVSTDTRTLQAGSLFVALTGEHFDGHTFLRAARHAGATGAVVRRGTPPVPELTLFEVDDTLRAYGKLARYRRRTIAGPVVAITGTNGKTSTKEMLLAVLRTKWKTHGTRSNNNNRVGVPLTILEAPADTEALVIEAGANTRGEIALLREIIEPSVGVVTNVAAGHLAGFHSVEGVLDEKASLLKDVPAAVVGEHPPALRARARALCRHVVVAGLSPEANVHPTSWELDGEGCGTFVYQDQTVRLNVPGEHQIANACVALGVAQLLELEGNVASALPNVVLPKGRCHVVHRGSLTIVDDTYNANPASLQAALSLVGALRAHRRVVVVVGSMLELGTESESLHRDAAAAILAIQPDLIGAVGGFAGPLQDGVSFPSDHLITAETVDDLGRALRGRLEGGELVLLKASRGVGLERIIPFLTVN